MRKLLVRYLSLQCVVVKGSLLGFLMVLLSPIFLLVFLIEKASQNKTVERILNKPILNKPIPYPGKSIIEEAGASCRADFKRLEKKLCLVEK